MHSRSDDRPEDNVDLLSLENVAKAILDGNVEFIQRFIQACGHSPVVMNAYLTNLPALLTAVSHRQLEILKLLVKVDCIDTNAASPYGDEALALAVRNNFYDGYDVLLASGRFNINFKNKKTGGNILHSLFSPRVINLSFYKNFSRIINDAVTHGVDTNQQNHDGATPLIILSRLQNVSMFEKLKIFKQFAQYGIVNYDTQDKNGINVLINALKYGGAEFIKYLLSMPLNPNLADVRGKTPLHYAVDSARFAGGVLLCSMPNVNLNPMDKTGETPLFLAARLGKLKAVQYLLQTIGLRSAGFDLSYFVNSKAKTLLDIAVDACIANEKYPEDTVHYVLIASARYLINIYDQHKQTVLHRAAKANHINVLKLLLAVENIDTELLDENGMTAIQLAEMHIDGVGARLIKSHQERQLKSPFSSLQVPLTIEAQGEVIAPAKPIPANKATRKAAGFIKPKAAAKVGAKSLAKRVVKPVAEIQIDESAALKIQSQLNAELEWIRAQFIDPMSGMSIENPITLFNGLLYDLENLKKQFSLQNNPQSIICPKTGLVIQDYECQLRPSLFAKLILDCLVDHDLTLPTIIEKISGTHFRDPITNNVIKDPIVLSNGLLYDRESLRIYFQILKNPETVVCPTTKAVLYLYETELSSSTLAKKLLDQFGVLLAANKVVSESVVPQVSAVLAASVLPVMPLLPIAPVASVVPMVTLASAAPVPLMAPLATLTLSPHDVMIPSVVNLPFTWFGSPFAAAQTAPAAQAALPAQATLATQAMVSSASQRASFARELEAKEREGRIPPGKKPK